MTSRAAPEPLVLLLFEPASPASSSAPASRVSSARASPSPSTARVSRASLEQGVLRSESTRMASLASKAKQASPAMPAHQAWPSILVEALPLPPRDCLSQSMAARWMASPGPSPPEARHQRSQESVVASPAPSARIPRHRSSWTKQQQEHASADLLCDSAERISARSMPDLVSGMQLFWADHCLRLRRAQV